MLSLKEVQEKIVKLDNWNMEGNSISKNFEFEDFKESMKFINKVADISEKEQHHPDIFISYNNVKLTLSTHSLGGLSEKDFILAIEIDKI